MARRRKPLEDVTQTSDADTSVKSEESPAVEESAVGTGGDGFAVQTQRERKPRGNKLRIFNGSVDWTSVGDKQPEVLEALRNDPSIKASVDASKAISPNLITEKHVNYFLDMIEFAEQFFLPRLLARKPVPDPLKPYFPTGTFAISQDVARRALCFSQKARKELPECGAEAANLYLPEAVKKVICKATGPGTEFGYKLVMELRAQQQTLIEMQIRENILAAQARTHREHPAPHKTNGVEPPAVPLSETRNEQTL